MALAQYFGILQRRWRLLAILLVIDALLSLASAARGQKAAGYQSCLTVYVADVSAPSVVAASSSLENAAQLIAGESAANFFADDILDVAQSRDVARYVAGKLPTGLPNSAYSDINGSVSGGRQDRTVNLCVSNPNQGTAASAAKVLASAVTVDRGRFVGKSMAKRTFVSLISPPDTTKAAATRRLVTLAERFILGLFLLIAAVLLWDSLDPRVRDRADVERILGLPVLAGAD